MTEVTATELTTMINQKHEGGGDGDFQIDMTSSSSSAFPSKSHHKRKTPVINNTPHKKPKSTSSSTPHNTAIKTTVSPFPPPISPKARQLMDHRMAMVGKQPIVKNGFKSASMTKMKKHVDLINKMDLKKTMPANSSNSNMRALSSSSSPPAQSFLTSLMKHVLPSSSASSPSLSRMTPDGNAMREDVDVVREFDQDVATALVCLGGSFLGLPQEDLLESPGMRKLVARNIRWFQGTPDVLKLLGLMAAKKLNQMVNKQTIQNNNNKRALSLPPPTFRTAGNNSAANHEEGGIMFSSPIPIQTDTTPLIKTEQYDNHHHVQRQYDEYGPGPVPDYSYGGFKTDIEDDDEYNNHNRPLYDPSSSSYDADADAAGVH